MTNHDEKWVRNHMDGIIRYETDIDRLNIQATVGGSRKRIVIIGSRPVRKILIAPEMTELNAATANATATGNYF